MISALWSNSNYDDDKGTRKDAIEEIESNYDEAVKKIMFGIQDTEEEIDKDNPFFSAVDRGLAKLETPRVDESATVKDVVGKENDYQKFIDQ